MSFVMLPPDQSYDDEVFDDCWAVIFTWLPLKKRIQLERVSQKWKRLMPYTDIVSVDMSDFIWPKGRFMVRTEDLGHVLLGVLSRCGPYLHCLSLTPPPWNVFGLNKDLADLLVQKAPSLVSLHLTRCDLSLHCFPVLAGLNKLEELHLDVLKVTDEEFSRHEDKEAINTVLNSTIHKLPALKKFHLESLSGLVCPTIRIAALRELSISWITLTATGVQDLVHNCPNLESLDIGSSGSTSDLQLGELGGLHKLKNLHLVGMILRSADLAAICRGCPNIEKLTLYCVKELTSCAELWRLPNLKHLDISVDKGGYYLPFAPVDDAVLASLARYELLEYVSLPAAKLTDDGLATLARCPNLATLQIPRIRSIADKGMKAVLEGCQKLVDLDVRHTSIGDETMAAIGAHGVRLAIVVALSTNLVTTHGIRRLKEEREKRAAEGQVLRRLEISVSLRDIHKYNSTSLAIVSS